MQKIKIWLNRIDLTEIEATEAAICHVHEIMNDYILSDLNTGNKVNESGFRIPLYVPSFQESIFSICQMYYGVKGFSRLIQGSSIDKTIQQYYFYGFSIKPEIAALTHKILLQQVRAIGEEYFIKHIKNEKSVKIRNYRHNRFCEGFLRNFFNGFLEKKLEQEEEKQLEQYLINTIYMPLNRYIANFEQEVIDRGNNDFDAGRDYFEARLNSFGAEMEYFKTMTAGTSEEY